MDDGKSKVEILQYLCAIYLRKAGEEYKEEFLYENSERLNLMLTLPMDIAIHVGFFLSSYQNTCPIISPSFGNPRSKVQENTARNISSVGAGSISSNQSQKQKSLIYQDQDSTRSIVRVRPRPSTFSFLPAKTRNTVKPSTSTMKQANQRSSV